MREIYCGMACNTDAPLLQAAFPLFENEKMEALEWSFDADFRQAVMPDWFRELLLFYAHEKRLTGHGIFFSLLDGGWSMEQDAWLKSLADTAREFPFAHVTEHFGFMSGANFHEGAPLPVPFNERTVAIGRDRLQRIADAAQCPAGIENLALALSLDDVKRHGDFLAAIVTPIGGFIILDLHNLYCQAYNFRIPFDELLSLYPLHLVREIHLSGGSWDSFSEDQQQQIRRDTHDASVPPEVFDYLRYALPRCPQLQFVFLEQLGTALTTATQQLAFSADFLHMQAIVEPFIGSSEYSTVGHLNFSADIKMNDTPITDAALHEQQRALASILETAPTLRAAEKLLQANEQLYRQWQVAQWQPPMLETALRIAQKWKRGWVK